jgi:menaquinone-specific isochorismate synthase
MALAGTLPRAEAAFRPELLKDPKELHEHNLVVQDLEIQLEKLVQSSAVHKSKTQILELPTLQHLVTYLEVQVTNVQVHDLVKLLHPTPALGVAPRNYGYHWMRDLPGQESRRWFGAPLVFSLPNKEAISLVAIRNIQWNEKESWIGAGCGIVAGSQIDREWAEVQHKLNSIFMMLGL